MNLEAFLDFDTDKKKLRRIRKNKNRKSYWKVINRNLILSVFGVE